MTIRELKKSLAKLGGDDENSHVILVTTDEKGAKKYGLLCGTAAALSLNAIFLADEDATKILLKEAEAKQDKEKEKET